MSLLKKAAKGTLKTAKKIGNAIAVEKHLPRIGVPKTDDLTRVEENDNLLKEIQKLMQVTHKTQELAKLSHFSYLEKLARTTKDECKRLFSKIKAENSQGDHLNEYKGHYIDQRNKFLNEAHKISRRIYLFCKHAENTFDVQLKNDTDPKEINDNKSLIGSLTTFYDQINIIK